MDTRATVNLYDLDTGTNLGAVPVIGDDGVGNGHYQYPSPNGIAVGGSPYDGRANITVAKKAGEDPEEEVRRILDNVPNSALEIQVGGDHYTNMAIQPIEYCIVNNIPFAEGNVIKYVSRWQKKGGVNDLRKARHILDVLIEAQEAKATLY